MNAFNNYIKCPLQQLGTADITGCYGKLMRQLKQVHSWLILWACHVNCIIMDNVIHMLTKGKKLSIMPARWQTASSIWSKLHRSKQVKQTTVMFTFTHHKSTEAIKFNIFNKTIVSQWIFKTDQFVDSFSWLYKVRNVSL